MIYENIKTIAKEKGISIAQIEKMAGLGNGTIGKWRNSNPGIVNLFKIAKALDVPFESLVKK